MNGTHGRLFLYLAPRTLNEIYLWYPRKKRIGLRAIGVQGVI